MTIIFFCRILLIINLCFIGLQGYGQNKSNAIIKVFDKDLALNGPLKVFRPSGVFRSEINYDTLISTHERLSDTSYLVNISDVKSPLVVRMQIINQDPLICLVSPNDTMILKISVKSEVHEDRMKFEGNNILNYSLTRFTDRFTSIDKFRNLNAEAKTVDDALVITDSLYYTNNKEIRKLPGENSMLKGILYDVNEVVRLQLINNWIDNQPTVSNKDIEVIVKKIYPKKFKARVDESLRIRAFTYPLLRSLDALILLDTSKVDLLTKKTKIIINHIGGLSKESLLADIFYHYTRRGQPDSLIANQWFSKNFSGMSRKPFKDLVKSALYNINLINKTIPDSVLSIRFYDQFNTQVSFNDILTKSTKAKVIDLWATWCGACISAFSENKKEVDNLKINGLDFVYISIDKNARESEMRTISKLYRLESYRIFEDDYLTFSKYFDINEIPRLLLMNEQGRLANNSLYVGTSDGRLTSLINESLTKH